MTGKFNKTEYMKLYMRRKRAKERAEMDKDMLSLKATEAIIGYMDDRNMRITWGDEKQRRELTEAELGRMMSAWQIILNEMIVWHQADEMGLNWDAWKGKTLVAMIREKGHNFNVVMNDRPDETFHLLTHAVNHVVKNS